MAPSPQGKQTASYKLPLDWLAILAVDLPVAAYCDVELKMVLIDVTWLVDRCITFTIVYFFMMVLLIDKATD